MKLRELEGLRLDHVNGVLGDDGSHDRIALVFEDGTQLLIRDEEPGDWRVVAAKP